MKKNDVIKIYTDNLNKLKLYAVTGGSQEEKDAAIFRMIRHLQYYIDDIHREHGSRSDEYKQAVLAVSSVLDRDAGLMFDNVGNFVKFFSEYVGTEAFIKPPENVIDLYNKCTEKLKEQLPKYNWGSKTKYVIHNSLSSMDSTVVKYAKSAAKNNNLFVMSNLVNLTSDNNLNIPIVFKLIEVFSGKNQQLDDKMEKIMKDNILAFAKWSITRKSSRTYDLIERPAMMSEFLEGKVSKISERYGDTMKEIIEERVRDEGCKYTDIKVAGEGGYSITYKVGDSVIKIGTTRATEKIPYHRRILQPVLRQQFEAYKDENGEPVMVDGRPSPGLFVEVSDRVEINPEACRGKLLDIFKEMYYDGVLWTDAKIGNVGILLKDNVPTIGRGSDKTSLDVDPIASGIYGKKREVPLKKGDIVIIDTDFIYKVGDKNIIWGVDDSGSTDIAQCKRWYEEQERNKAR